MNMETVCNRTPLPDRTVAAGEILEGVQLCPVGEWKNGEKAQHCTEEALQGVCNRWQAAGSPEILVDFEHQAEAGGTSDTSAAAWATNLRVEPGKGLVADFRMTDLGAEAVSNRRLRFLSVAWGLDRKTREPVELYSIALTNKPNIPVEPVLNRVPMHLPPEFRLTPDLNEQTPTKDPNMDKLKSLLGLAPDATEEDIASAVAKLKTRLDELESAAADAEAETFAETNKAKADKAVLKAQYLANKEVARAIVEAIPAPKAPETPAETQQILNKAGAKTPRAKEDVVKELNKLPAGEARVKFVLKHQDELAEAAIGE
jgi:phage I-like protein